jgi:hypothetical protein
MNTRAGSAESCHGCLKLGARLYPEFAVGVAQVVLDRLRAEEQRRSGLTRYWAGWILGDVLDYEGRELMNVVAAP